MNYKQKYFWRLFLTTGSMFGALQYAFGLWWAPPIPWWSAVLQGIIFGFIMALFGTFVQFRYMKERGIRVKSEADLRPEQEQEVLIDQDIEVLWQALVDHFSRQKGWKIKERDGLRGRLVLRHGMTWQSWGEKVTLDLRDVNDGFTLLKIRSVPTLSSTMVDYGRNRENVEAILTLLRPLDRRGADADWDREGREPGETTSL